MVKQFYILLLFILFSNSAYSDTIWHKSVIEGFAVAKKKNIPVLIDLYADWCTYCKVLEKEIFPAKEVSALLNQFVTIRINGEEYPNLMERYKVKGFPTILFLDKNGYYLSMLTGLPTKDMIIKRINEVYKQKDIEDSLIRQQKSKPLAIESNYKLAVYYYQIAELEKALQFFQKAAQAAGNDSKRKHDSRYNMSLLYMDLERFADAVTSWSEYMQQFPNGDIFSALYFRGIAYSNLGKNKMAKLDYEKAMKIATTAAQKKELEEMIKTVSSPEK